MLLVRYRLHPLSPWVTPWQADTLTGLLCCAMARRDGRERMYKDIQRPALDGAPPFVLSDAFPGDLLPVPITVRLQKDWAPDERKAVKRARWLTRDAFQRAQSGQELAARDLAVPDPFAVHDRWRNTLDRLNGSAGGEGGNLFASTEVSMTAAAAAEKFLSLYARVTEDWRERLTGLLRELAETGFGADASVGRGQFELLGEPEDASWLDSADTPRTGCIALSTFQPAPGDPTDGHWESFVKYGKLAPDFGIDGVFKHPLLMLRPGAVLAMPAGSPTRLGRAVPMKELLPASTATALVAQGVSVIQLAFGLAVPFAFAGLHAAPLSP